jgi:hypothetical protein
VISTNETIRRYREVESMEGKRVVKQAVWYSLKEEDIMVDHAEGGIHGNRKRPSA